MQRTRLQQVSCHRRQVFPFVQPCNQLLLLIRTPLSFRRSYLPFQVIQHAQRQLPVRALRPRITRRHPQPRRPMQNLHRRRNIVDVLAQFTTDGGSGLGGMDSERCSVLTGRSRQGLGSGFHKALRLPRTRRKSSIPPRATVSSAQMEGSGTTPKSLL